jgi:hypothetical protein
MLANIYQNNLLSSRLLSKNLKIIIYGTTILPVVLYDCEARSLTLREEHRLKVIGNRVLRGMFRVLERTELRESWENSEMGAS